MIETVQNLEGNVKEIGPKGLSAYEVYVKNGGTLSEAEWLESLRGADGKQGPQGEPGAVKMQVVDTLSDVGETDTIYLLKKTTPGDKNLYDEYVYTETSGWEHIGDTSVDLTDYYTKEETDEKLEGKQNITTTFFIDIPSQTISLLDTSTRYTLPNSFNNQLSNIINNIFEKYQRFSLQFLINNVLVTFSPSTYSASGGLGTPVISSHPTQLSLYGMINYSRQNIDYTTDPTLFFSYIPLILTISMSWVDDTVTISSSRFKMYGQSSTIPSVDYFRNNTLTKTNTTSYTPTANYHPATKKYVDDNKYTLPVADADTLGGIKLGEGLSADENGVVSVENNNDIFIFTSPYNLISFTGSLYKTITDTNLINEINNMLTTIYTNFSNKKYIILIKDNFGNVGVATIASIKDEKTNVKNFNIRFPMEYYVSNPSSLLDNTNAPIFVDEEISFYGFVENNTIDISTSKTNMNYNYRYLTQGGGTSTNLLGIYKSKGPSIGIFNTGSYTPTSNYHPSTKLYTDKTHYEKMTGYDATKTQVLKNVNGTLTWVDE